MTDYYKSSAEETLRELQTSQTGLTYRQAQAKRSKELQNYFFNLYTNIQKQPATNRPIVAGCFQYAYMRSLFTISATRFLMLFIFLTHSV